MPDLLDKFQGCLLGLALGDALCAGREGGLPERLLWLLIGRTRQGLRRWTDDTQMSIDLAAHLARNGCIDQYQLAADFTASFCWSRGYGPGTATILKKIRAGVDWRTAARAKYPSGSFGNGAAMRIAPAALFFHHQPDALAAAVEQISVITHPNPAAIAGAQLIAQAIVHGLRATEPLAAARTLAAAAFPAYIEKMQLVVELLTAGRLPEPKELRQQLGTGSAAVNSCPAAIFLGLHFSRKAFAELIAFVRRCKGDNDTIGAMAGAIWGACNGYSLLPSELVRSVEAHERLLELAAALHETFAQRFGKTT